MRIAYIALDPQKSPRIKKIAHTLRKHNEIAFKIMVPKFRIKRRGGRLWRFLIATANYSVVLLQVLLVRADIFWVANCPDILALPLILRRKRYILEYRSPWAIEIEGEFGSGRWVTVAASIERLVLSRSWIITLTTSKLKTRVEEFGKPIFVIPNYPLKTFGASVISRDQTRKQLGLSREDKVVLFVGKLSRVEGVDLLPKIIESVLKKDDVIFWVVGGGPLYDTLRQLEREFPKNVRLFGWQPHDKIPSFIAAADVCIAPRHKSRFSMYYNEEGVSKFSEYMFFEKPIVACGVAESEEYLLVVEDEMADGIVMALNGEVPLPRPRTWEDHSERNIDDLLNSLSFK